MVATSKTSDDIFYDALKFVLANEGGYSNRANDLGGETYAGISRQYHPKWEGWQIIDDIKEDYSPTSPHFKDSLLEKNIYSYVISFYRDNFWNILHLNNISSEKIAVKIFDMAVNLGIPRAASLVQLCLNLMNYGVYFELKVDNIIGGVTINLINQMTKNDNG